MYRNSEHYADPTAGAAFAHIAYAEAEKTGCTEKEEGGRSCCGNPEKRKG